MSQFSRSERQRAKRLEKVLSSSPCSKKPAKMNTMVGVDFAAIETRCLAMYCVRAGNTIVEVGELTFEDIYGFSEEAPVEVRS